MAACDAWYKFRYVNLELIAETVMLESARGAMLDANLSRARFVFYTPALLPGTETITTLVFMGDEAFPQKLNLI